jgi:Holliday junction resolvasome RuvABC ATP-dependent DNA helicase subunit
MDPYPWEGKPREKGETLSKWAKRVLDIELETHPNVPSELDYFGQESVKSQIEPFITRQKPFPNVLILGHPGIGKTRLAKWIAARRGEPFEEMLCPLSPDDLPLGGLVLLDECHLQRKPEYLFPYMEGDSLSILGATTRPEQLEPAFKSRFQLILHLKRQNESAMADMAQSILEMSDEAAKVYAGASAGIPRQLENILDVAAELGPENTELVLETVRITPNGLTEYHISMLEALGKAGRPTGLQNLAGWLMSDEQTIREHEQLLIERDFIELRPNGRSITRRGRRYLEILEQT